MVFESIIVDVLNRFLGDYVENLDRSQLKVGIWGGDVVLENLILKQNALEELNIPVQTVYGHLGKLVLKIPWKNLYGASVEATVERLFLIVNPVAEVKYDQEKEEKMELAAKQAELRRIEAAKKAEAEMDENKLDETFVEKLVTQIIKNVQLNIKDIHIRYEDSITNPKAPFSFGITLHNLSVHTTDENWTKTVIQEAVTKIFKILSLEGLAIYWNPATEQYSKNDMTHIKTRLKNEIATKSEIPTSYSYVLGPINATAKLKLNPKPENDTPKFSIPKVILSLHMERLLVNLSRDQYQDIMLLADSMDRMTKAAPFRKYRPDLRTYRGHYKEWWKYAYTCVLEEEVKRRRRNWDWAHILGHRQLLRDYAQSYQVKLNCKGKVPPEHVKVLEVGEKKLDLFNLVVIRQKIEMEVERLGKLEAKARKSQGWFSGWWGGADAKDDELAEGTDILKQFEKAMTQDEKDKLFRAIDYQENCAPLHLPVEYVAMESHFSLDRLQLTVTNKGVVLSASVDDVGVGLLQRPSANALRVDVTMQKFSVRGVSQNGVEPQLVKSEDVSEHANLLNVMFETNPLDAKCDQRVRVVALPLQITYDAQTVIEIVNVFKPAEESNALTTLQAAAENKLSDLKEKSTLGMQYAVHKHTFIDIDINIAASYIVVPQTGVYTGSEPCIVVKLGAVDVRSAPRSQQVLSVRQLVAEGLADADILDQITEHIYDKVALTLTEMQIVVAMRGEDWLNAITSVEASPLHLLQPTNLMIQVHKCLITDDPRLPKVKVTGELEKIAIGVSEDRLLTLCEIVVSMPLPQAEESTQLKPSESKGSSLSLLRLLDPAEKQKRESARVKKRRDEHLQQLTELEAFFVMKELKIIVHKKTAAAAAQEKLLVFSLNLLELQATQKTFNLETVLRLGSVALELFTKDQVVHMIQTPALDSQTNQPCLFTVTYVNVDKKCPEFHSRYKSVEQLIVLQFKTLVVLLHLECLQQILVIVNEYQTRLQDIQKSHDRIATAGPLETIMEDEEMSATKSKASVTKISSRTKVESIQLKVKINISSIKLGFATERRPLSDVELKGMSAKMIVKSSYTQVDCSLASIRVEDLNPLSLHKEILKVLGGDIINVQVVLYNAEQCADYNDVNMSIDAQINCMRIIFLNWFVSSMLEFLNNFQTAQQAIIDASSQAADAARANVQTAYENSTKVALKVRFAAPIIIIPENSTSHNAIMVDFGRLTLQNKFVNVTVPELSKQVTLDDLTLSLDDMKLSCVTLSVDDQHVTSERKLLQPTSVKLFVKRNLSTWYEGLPAADVSGRLNTVSIVIGQSDYKSIMKILNQNLQEGLKAEEAKAQQTVSKAQSKATVKSQPSKQTLQTKAVVNAATSAESKKPTTAVKFSFTMESFVIDLVNTVTNDEGQVVSDAGLARLCLLLLSVKGRAMSDGCMHTALLLLDCTLDDMRPGRGGKITRYLERRRETPPSTPPNSEQNVARSEQLRSMIDITYTMKDGDTFIDLRIFSFNLILAMDFLNRVAEFAKTGLEEAQGETPRVSAATPAVKADVKKRTISVSEPVDSEVQTRASMLTLNLKIEQPDIFLVESLEHRDSDALVINMEVRFKLRQTPTRLVTEGGISGLQMVVGRCGIESTRSRVLLAPVSVTLAASRNEDQALRLHLQLDCLKLTVSPDVIALLSKALATMTSSEDDNVEQEQKALVYDRLWDVKPFKQTDYWFLKTEEALEAITLEESSEQVKSGGEASEICLVSCPTIILSLQMEIGADTIPVLVMQASLDAHLKDWSSEFYMESTWAMQVSYYNIGRAVWEPLLEPVEVLKDYQYKHVPWELKMEVAMRPQEAPAAIDTTDEAANLQLAATRQAHQSITVTSSEPLELTLTRTAMEVLTLLGNTFSAAVADSEDKDSTIHKIKNDKVEKKYVGAPYVLHNTTGLTAKLMLNDNPDFAVFLDKEQAHEDYK
ncbi:hypothetical protein JYU34_006387 [Plutella xylostella]|uniref:Vacuolar protein sorting-associated protein 13 n=1 Tax=Plutella xylostella TaxID=51655 RepID=A0ABQ7QRV9_PLUXY|nr:hypothetical protein JYU34_006387 [Plutella xylostella]